MNLVVAGPVSVGKTTVARRLARRANMAYRNFDEEGKRDMAQRHGAPSPFSMRWLNLKESVPSILDGVTMAFVLDLGGETIFRRGADNEERLGQVFWLKATYSADLVVLTASKDVLLARHRSSRNGNDSGFESTWTNWCEISEPRWRQAEAAFVDTSALSPHDVVNAVEALSETHRRAGRS